MTKLTTTRLLRRLYTELAKDAKELAKDAPPPRGLSWVHYIINARARRHAAAAKAIANCAPGQSSEAETTGRSPCADLQATGGGS